MKMRKFMAMLAIALMSAGFVGCTDDDDPADTDKDPKPDVPVVPETPVEPEVADANLPGTYLGARALKMKNGMNFDSTYVVKISEIAEGKYSLNLPESVIPSDPNAHMSIPPIELKDLVLKKIADGVFTVVVDSFNYVSPEKTILVKNLQGKIDVKKKALDMTYTLQPKGMPMALNYTFKPLTPVEFISGAYYGKTEMKVGGSVMPDSNNVTRIIAQSNGKISVSFPQKVTPEVSDATAGRAGMAMPAVTLKDIDLQVNNDGTFSFALDTIDVVADQMHIVGNNLKGKVTKNQLVMDFTFRPGKMPMYINTNFTGEKKKK